jgi:hypothetical protein
VERSTPYEGKPRENEIENPVDQFDMDPELAHDTVRRAVDIEEMVSTVNGSKERAVQPSPSLRNQLRNLWGAVQFWWVGELRVVDGKPDQGCP